MNTIQRYPTAIYQKTSRLSWYAVALTGPDGKLFMVAAQTPNKAISLAKNYTLDTSVLVAERIDIRKGKITKTKP